MSVRTVPSVQAPTALANRAKVAEQYATLEPHVQVKLDKAAQLDALGLTKREIGQRLGTGPNETEILVRLGRQHVRSLHGAPADEQARRVLAQVVLVVREMGLIVIDETKPPLDRVAAAKALLLAVDRQAKLLQLWRFDQDDLDPAIQQLLVQTSAKAGAAAALLGVKVAKELHLTPEPTATPAAPTHDVEALVADGRLGSTDW